MINLGYAQGSENLGGMNKEFKELRSQCFGSISHVDTETTKCGFRVTVTQIQKLSRYRMQWEWRL